MNSVGTGNSENIKIAGILVRLEFPLGILVVSPERSIL